MIETTCQCGNKTEFEVLTSTILGNQNELILHQMIKCLNETCGQNTYIRTALDGNKIFRELSNKKTVEAPVA